MDGMIIFVIYLMFILLYFTDNLKSVVTLLSYIAAVTFVTKIFTFPTPRVEELKKHKKPQLLLPARRVSKRAAVSNWAEESHLCGIAAVDILQVQF
jgi:hypothetical protein